MSGTILSILMLAGMALLAGGIVLIVKHKNRKQGGLMLLAALIMFANVAIWAIPGPKAPEAPGISAQP